MGNTAHLAIKYNWFDSKISVRIESITNKSRNLYRLLYERKKRCIHYLENNGGINKSHEKWRKNPFQAAEFSGESISYEFEQNALKSQMTAFCLSLLRICVGGVSMIFSIQKIWFETLCMCRRVFFISIQIAIIKAAVHRTNH